MSQVPDGTGAREERELPGNLAEQARARGLWLGVTQQVPGALCLLGGGAVEEAGRRTEGAAGTACPKWRGESPLVSSCPEAIGFVLV